MDHIPYPVATSVPPVEVPLLIFHTGSCSDELSAGPSKGEELNENLTVSACTAIQDNLSTGGAPGLNSRLTSEWTLDFWEYPQRQGWTISGSQPWWTSDVEETARRAQEWMYFGLLQQFLGEPLEVNSLVRKNETSGSILLDSSIIPELLTRWLARQRGSQQEAQNYIGTSCGGSRRESRVLSLLTEVALECNELDTLPAPAQSTALAIRVLLETLENAIYDLAHVKVSGTRDVQRLEKNHLLEHRFLANGWCRFQVARLWGQYSPSTTYYLSSLPRETTFGGVKHDQCDETRCMTTSIDPATYEHRHVDSCPTHDGSCRMVGVSSSEVAACIKRGHIPLIGFEESTDGSLRPKMVESSRGLRYVALSHVWSGGLGNVNMNSMFCCQIRKLYNLLLRLRDEGDDDYDRDLGTRKFPDAFRDLRKDLRIPLPDPPVLLWIDTLCVPVSQQHKDIRQIAIAQMAQIYVEAQCVLVVDPELEMINHQSLPDEQIFANVLCSSWNSRSWTFQEACMARVFYVQFLDGHCVIDKKWHEFIEGIEKTAQPDTSEFDIAGQTFVMREVLMAEVSDWFCMMPVMTKVRGYDNRTLMSRSEDWENFARVWNGLRRRSTTKTDDLYGIIAIMVDLSAYEILKLDPKERMKAILRSQATLPLPLLYQHCDRLRDLDGKLLWAPSGIAGDRLEMDRGYMCVEENGVVISSHKPDAARHVWPDAYIFSTQGPLPTSFTVRFAQFGHSLSIELCQASSMPFRESTHTWVVLCKETPKQKSAKHMAPGVLLLMRTSERPTIETDYICPLRISIDNRIGRDCNRGHPLGKAERSMRYFEGAGLSLNEFSIKVGTDMSSWYKPKLRISKRLLSTSVIMRNSGNLFVFGATALSSGLCLFAIIGCAVHHREPLVRKILYYLIARYLFIFLELLWVMKVIVTLDEQRTSRWSTRLYGEVKVSLWHKIRTIFLYPFCTTNVAPLIIGSVFIALYHTYRWDWARWLGVIGLTELVLRVVFVCVSTPVFYYTVKRGWCTMKLEDISDMPEDMTNYSRKWRERNEKDRARRLARKDRVKGWITYPKHAGDWKSNQSDI